MRVRIGTSGFSYKEWKGPFYPADLPASKMLGFYAGRMDTVEINATFYRMPTPKLLEGFRAQVGPDFVFVLKASRKITHIKRLKEVGDEVDFFFKSAGALGPALGPTLVQLPPNAKQDLARLEAFLASVPKGKRVALEFRHESWFTDETYRVLKAHDAALCIAEADDFETPHIETASFGYLRLRKTDYSQAALDKWAKEIRGLAAKEVFVFFKHEDAGKGPAFAAELRARLD
jgi:uncharacterized protein YecE (DUF72 family)